MNTRKRGLSPRHIGTRFLLLPLAVLLCVALGTAGLIAAPDGNTTSASAGAMALAEAAPALTDIAPTSGPTTGGQTVTVTGSGFSAVGGVTVTIGGVVATDVVVSGDTKLTAVTGPTTIVGVVDVTVATENGSTTLARAYNYTAPPPTITGITPTTGPTTGGQEVTVTGTGFTNLATVGFGALPVVATVQSSTQLTAITPPGVTGVVSVTVVTIGGSASAPNAYTYVEAGTATPTDTPTGLVTDTETPTTPPAEDTSTSPPTLTPVDTSTPSPTPTIQASDTPVPSATSTVVTYTTSTPFPTVAPLPTLAPPLAVPTLVPSLPVTTPALLSTPPPVTLPVAQPTVPVTATPTVGATPPSATETTLYFAEGYTGRQATNGRADFDEGLAVLNPDPVTKTVTFAYQRQGQREPLVKTVTVGAQSAQLQSVTADVGTDQTVSALVQADGRLAVARVINRSSASATLAASTSLGSPAPRTTWYFAEGYTGATFQEYLTVQNPGSGAAHVTATFVPQGATAGVRQGLSVTVPAGGRVTENLRRDAGATDSPATGMIVTSDQPVVAERVAYWGDGVGSAKFGTATQPGTTQPGTQFFFAYGSDTGARAAPPRAAQPNDESYLAIINPASAANVTATVTATFFSLDGRRLASRTLAVAALTRQTLAVKSVLPAGAGAHWTAVTADHPVVVEQPQYFGGSPNSGRHPGLVTPGTPDGVTAMLFPNLETATATGTPMSQTVFLLNPGTSPLVVQATYFATTGQTVPATYTIGAGAVQIVDVNTAAASLPPGPLGAEYTATGGSLVAASIGKTGDGLSYLGTAGAASQSTP